jgi:acyl carrier protein
MFRLAARSALRASTFRSAQTPAFARFYSANSLSIEEITRRIAEANSHLIKNAAEVTGASNLASDLGLDSLDATEFLVNVENEFDLQFSDEDSEKVKTVSQIVDLIASKPEAH